MYATALVLALTGSVAWTAGAAPPVAVSPASDHGLAVVEARCPTFSWTSVANQDGYELVVYRLAPATKGGADARIDAQPVLAVRVPSAANSWTPTLERCLAEGERYAWSIRPRNEGSQGDWSEPSFFQIAPQVSAAALDQAVALLRRELSTGTSASSAGAASSNGAAATAPGAVPPAARANGTKAAQGSPTFAVDGVGNVTANHVSASQFSGNGALLTGVQAVTAGALASNGANCANGQVPIGIDAAGNAEGCLGVLFPADLATHEAGGAHDARYLRLTGGTLSGPLIAPSFQGDGSALTGIVASTAQSLAANGSNCAPGTAPLGVSATGAAEDCFNVTTDDELIAHLLGGDHDNRYLRLTGGALTGALSATSFSGNGAALTNVAAVSATTATTATTATQLSSDPGNCNPGSAARGINQSGAAQDCFTVAPLAHTFADNGDHDTRYLRQTGGTLTGSLTINSATLSVNNALFTANGAQISVDGVIRSRCPFKTGSTSVRMVQAGSWCIDDAYAALPGTNALLVCNSYGMTLCPIQALMICDAGNAGSGPDSCGVLTDQAGFTARTSTIDVGTGTVFNRMLRFAATGNVVSVVDDSEQLRYFCCRSLSGFNP